MKNKRYVILTAALAAGLIIASFAALLIGRYPLNLREIFMWFKGSAADKNTANILLNIRLPRVLGAIFTGACLSCAGAAYQGIFRNPMVSPDILGATSGAGLGAAIAIVLSLHPLMVQLFAFTFGVAAVAASYTISVIAGRRENIALVLILSGMVVTSLLGAFVSVVKYTADPYNKLPEITYWLMGSLSAVTLKQTAPALLPVAAGFAVIIAVRWRINVLSYGDEEARSLGVDPKRLRIAIIGAATLLTAAAVSICGQIGWVGLVIPHITRMTVGPDYRRVIPVTALMGGLFMLAADTVSRGLFRVEIPLGILTAIIGAPVFVYLLFRGKRGWM
jgi:iron complex transport system permease protein